MLSPELFLERRLSWEGRGGEGKGRRKGLRGARQDTRRDGGDQLCGSLIRGSCWQHPNSHRCGTVSHAFNIFREPHDV